MSVESAQAEARRLRQDVWGDRLPVDPKELGFLLMMPFRDTLIPIHFETADLHGASGMAMLDTNHPEGPRFLCVANRGEPHYRSRFTMAHELGHVVLGHVTEESPSWRDEDFKLARSQPGYSHYEEERDANAFAAELLMPEEGIRPMLDLGLTLSGMADRFGVSPTAMNWRLINLGIT